MIHVRVYHRNIIIYNEQHDYNILLLYNVQTFFLVENIMTIDTNIVRFIDIRVCSTYNNNIASQSITIII